jgi:hypothetical protein
MKTTKLLRDEVEVEVEALRTTKTWSERFGDAMQILEQGKVHLELLRDEVEQNELGETDEGSKEHAEWKLCVEALGDLLRILDDLDESRVHFPK